MSARVYGTPARFAKAQRARIRRRLAQQVVVAAAAVVGAGLWLDLWKGPVWVSLFAVCGLALLAGWSTKTARADAARAGRYTRGIRAEQATTAAARTCPQVSGVFCGIQPGRQAGSREDIDVLLVLTTGLVVLCEVKHVAGGAVDWDGSNLVTGAGRVIPRAPNPIDQVLRQRDLLLADTELDPASVKPMVVCSGATTPPFAVGPVLVTNTADLPDVLVQATQRQGPGVSQVIKALRRL